MKPKDKDGLITAQLILPPHLHSLGYFAHQCVIELGRRAVVIKTDRIDFDPKWFLWRGIFEYLSCVEYAKYILKSLPTGSDVKDMHGLPAKYNSASLVFFAQATLDNMAVWMSKQFSINSKGSNLAFHSKSFIKELNLVDNDIGIIIDKHIKFINILKNYRTEWIHRITGGADVYSDRSPNDSACIAFLAVPINPKINHYEGTGSHKFKMIQECRDLNGGKWLYSIGEFADMIGNGAKEFTLDILSKTLSLIPST